MFKCKMDILPVLFFAYVLHYYITITKCDKLPHDVTETITQSNTTFVPTQNYQSGFFQAFFGSFSMIVFSELGDKTFFIAAIMAMKHSRIIVFAGAILALSLMTIFSVAFGLVATLIPKVYTYYISTILFLIFGLKMLWDGIKMSPNEAQEEMEEVQADLRRREDEAAAKYDKKRTSPMTTTLDTSPNQVLPEVEAVDSSSGGGSADNTKQLKQAENVVSPPQFEKEALTKDPEIGRVMYNNKKKVIKVIVHIILQSFTLTFLAEWGDRSQIATIALAARDNMYGVTIGAILGHGLCTSLAVLGGRFVAQKISVRTVTIAGGIVFILFAVMTFFMDDSVDKKLPI